MIKNNEAAVREVLEEAHGAGDVFDTDQLRVSFNVESFCAPFVVVTRKSDGVRGDLMFMHSPRFYYQFIADKE